jgi:hypothetical protein
MPGLSSKAVNAALIERLYPLAEQASLVLSYLAQFPAAAASSDIELAGRVGLVSAEHVAIVRRSLVEGGLAEVSGFSSMLLASSAMLEQAAANLDGIATYQRIHKDRDTVRLVITEPGERSALRTEISSRHALPPQVFQTTDAFMNLARAAKRELIVMAPFIDEEGAAFLVSVFSLCNGGVKRHLICRPLNEEHCGPAFMKRRADFVQLNLIVHQYALPAALPSGRETFHAKVLLADDSAYYVGSSNPMGSALGRSLECGVIVRGESARQLYSVIDAVRAVSIQIQY